MPAPLRYAPAFPSQGLTLLSLFFGFFHVSAFSAMLLLFDLNSTTPIITAGFLILPPLFFVIALAMLDQARRRVLFNALAYSLGFASSFLIITQFFLPDAGFLFPTFASYYIPLMGSLGWAVLVLVVAILINLLIRSIFVRVLTQPQPLRYCWRCAYDLGLSPSLLCSECGCDNRSALPRLHNLFRFASWFWRRRAPAAAALVLALLAIELFLFLTRARPCQRLFAALEPASVVVSGDTIVCELHSNHPGLGFTIHFRPSDNFPITLYLFDHRPSINPSGTPYNVSRVSTVLDRRQTDVVLSRGLPTPLIDALAANVTDLEASPSSSPSGVPTPVEVDPDPFFNPPAPDSPASNPD